MPPFWEAFYYGIFVGLAFAAIWLCFDRQGWK